MKSNIDHNHSFAPEAVTIKCKEKDWFRRVISEAIWIAKENLSLNRDRSRHTLPRSTTNFCRHITLTSHRDHVTSRKLQTKRRRPEVSGRKLLTFTYKTGENMTFYQYDIDIFGLTPKKPFQCNICGAVQKTHLTSHLFSHVREKHFYCNVCPATFVSDSKLLWGKPFCRHICDVAHAQ